MPRGLINLMGERRAFWLVFGLITVLLLSGSLWVLNYVRGIAVTTAEAEERPLPTYINYSADGSYISDESNTAIQQYVLEFPQPQNVQILEGLNTSEVWAFMTSYMAAGLKVDCTYCHNIQNFADDGTESDEWAARKANAREHLLLVQDLNRNWLTQLAEIEGKQPSGAQIVCATCHNGEPLPVSWPEDLHGLPDDFRLPLRDADGNPGTVADIDNALVITGREDVSLDAVQYNQYTMYHQNESLGVGCTHCHNSRYFPSWEQPAKYYAYTMLQMNQHILAEYQDTMNGQEPSCYLCHQNNVRPPGAAISADVLPDALTAVGE